MGTHGAAPPPHARSRAGFSVVALGRSPTRGSEVLREMRAAGGGQHEFISCDAFSLQNLAQAAADIRASHKAVDVLVLSQGMATIQVCHTNTARVRTRTFTRRRTHKNNRTKKNPHPPNHPHRKTDTHTHTHTHMHTQGFTPTVDGNDEKLTLHYWGRMALISELLPALRAAPEARVISVLSGGVHSAFPAFATDPELKHSYSIKAAADAAGFYNDLGLDAFAVQSTNANIAFVHAAPGFVQTSWGTEMPWYLCVCVCV